MIALLTLSTDRYVLVVALSDAPFLILLLAWSVYYSFGVFRRSEQWGALLASADARPGGGGAVAPAAPGIIAARR
jgi:hypothetical protein